MKPIRKILVPIDLDVLTDPVMNLVRQVAVAFGAEVELIHVFETSGYHGPAFLDLSLEHSPELEHWRTAKVMVGLLKTLALDGITARGRMAFGVVEEEVASLAEKEGFDLVIIASHSREGLDRFVQSSVAAALLRRAHCPVLVLPHVHDKVPG
jgi:nucleotide-binding universal stress UspA family protein